MKYYGFYMICTKIFKSILLLQRIARKKYPQNMLLCLSVIKINGINYIADNFKKPKL